MGTTYMASGAEAILGALDTINTLCGDQDCSASLQITLDAVQKCVDCRYIMFACSECVGAPTFGKLTTHCDVSHMMTLTRPSSPLFFPFYFLGGGGRPGNEATLLVTEHM